MAGQEGAGEVSPKHASVFGRLVTEQAPDGPCPRAVLATFARAGWTGCIVQSGLFQGFSTHVAFEVLDVISSEQTVRCVPRTSR